MITMASFVGNKDLIRLLQISIEAAKARNAALPHTLLRGPAGAGKTTLAEAVAREFGTEPWALTPYTAKNNKELRKLFQRMPGEGYDHRGKKIGTIHPQIIFIDEIHQLTLLAQENLGIAMQDWKLPVQVGGKDVFEWVPRFTLIGATTLPGKLSKPFRDRFKIQSEFETYSYKESIQITYVHAKLQGIVLAPGVAEAVARRSRGIPRLVVRFLDRLADAAIVASSGNLKEAETITLPLAEIVFKQFLRVDDRGLTGTDVKILKQLAIAQDPVGIDTLATITNEDKATIEGVTEPYLVQEGLIERTKRGRVLTEEGRRYLSTAGYLQNANNSRGAARLIGEDGG
jgi:Holliday junction DNA helicase RuvB